MFIGGETASTARLEPQAGVSPASPSAPWEHLVGILTRDLRPQGQAIPSAGRPAWFEGPVSSTVDLHGYCD